MPRRVSRSTSLQSELRRSRCSVCAARWHDTNASEVEPTVILATIPPLLPRRWAAPVADATVCTLAMRSGDFESGESVARRAYTESRISHSVRCAAIAQSAPSRCRIACSHDLTAEWLKIDFFFGPLS